MPEKKGVDWSPLWKLEDWWAVWFGFILIFLIAGGLITKVPKIGTWATLGEAFPASNWVPLLTLMIGLGILTAIGIQAMGKSAAKYALAFPVVFALAVLASACSSYTVAKAYNLETPLWGLAIGLLISNTIRTPDWLKPAVKTEMYIKTGLVFLGCEILFNRIVALGAPGLIVAWFVTPIVVIFMYWFGMNVLKMESPEFCITLSAATSVCGVSAAIAAGAASGAKKEEIGVAITISLIFTVLMMVGMPALILATGLDPDVGAAWMGGTIDATGAVVAAGAFLGQRGLEISSVVKMIQNVLIGIIAFVVAIIWVTKMGREESAQHAAVKEIWIRFPKFILGFVAASLVFSFIFIPAMGEAAVDGFLKSTKAFRGWLFAMAFISIGLDSNFKDLINKIEGGKPLVQYIVGQSFNLVLTLFIAWLCFGGILFPKTW
ncbi:MAG TPA: putative sulfate exporter family transporter [Clostridia bacterium]|nr:putative sulfate exporter family transporter [Clostridia bacterium]